MQSNLPVDVVRDAVTKGAHNAQQLVSTVTPADVDALSADESGFLIVYRDSCPFCRALRGTLVDLLLQMHSDEALRDGKVKLHFLDSHQYGDYTRSRLAVRSVPTIFLVDGGKVEQWSDADKVLTSRTDAGTIVKQLPIAAMLATLRGMNRQRRLRAAAATGK
jgi:hypothetical protein